MKSIRLAIVGAGVMGQSHASVLARSTSACLSGLVDPAPAAQALARKAGVPLWTSLAELLAMDRPDGLIIATPNGLHVPQALEAVAAGVPILLEKPVATSVADGQRLVQAVQAARARVLVGHHRAHSPIMASAREVVASGRLGRLVAVQGSATFFKPDRYFADGPWRAQPGGGPILLNLIHEVHNLRMLCGEITEVQAMASRVVRRFPVEDTAVINLRFESGVLGSFVLSDTAASARSWEQTSQENKVYASYPDEDCYVISGTMGSLAVPSMRIKTYAQAEARSWTQPFQESRLALQREDPLLEQMAHFVDMITLGTPPKVSVRDGLQNLRVTEAVVEAVRTAGVVKLD